MVDLTSITELIGAYGYFGIFILVFLETALFFMLPGDSFLFGAGILAGTGYIKLSFLIPVIFVSTFLGSFLSYFIGINIEKLRRYAFLRKIIKEEYLEKAYEFFDKYGFWAIIFSRFVPNFRTFVPMVAGISLMNRNKFLKANLFGSILRSLISTLLGFFLGGQFPEIQKFVPYAVLIGIIVAFTPIVMYFFKKKTT